VDAATEEPDSRHVDAPALRRSEWDAAAAKRRPLSTRAEMAAQQLAEFVASVGPGGRLGTKDHLRAWCGVSVGTFNEALRLLQARGLVTVRSGPGGGLFACEPAPIVRLGNVMLALDAHRASVADAIRVRNALDVLLVEDAVWHADEGDIAGLRDRLAHMAAAAESSDGIAFLHANLALHARIAAISRNVMLSSIYIGLLDVIEAHTLGVVPAAQQPLPESLWERHQVHARLVDAIAVQDPAAALGIIDQHNATVD
jgi:DNA-binding FadR family transcriptional regulator